MTSYKISWSKTSIKLGMEMVAGVQTRQKRFICPIFHTKHSIRKIPITINGRTVHTTEYRGHTYWLEKYYNHIDTCNFFRFGLMEKRKGSYLLRQIADISHDLRMRYIYDVHGSRCKTEIFTK